MNFSYNLISIQNNLHAIYTDLFSHFKRKSIFITEKNVSNRSCRKGTHFYVTTLFYINDTNFEINSKRNMLESLENPDFRELRSAEHGSFVNFDEVKFSPLACHRAWFLTRMLLIAYSIMCTYQLVRDFQQGSIHRVPVGNWKQLLLLTCSLIFDTEEGNTL